MQDVSSVEQHCGASNVPSPFVHNRKNYTKCLTLVPMASYLSAASWLFFKLNTQLIKLNSQLIKVNAQLIKLNAQLIQLNAKLIKL